MNYREASIFHAEPVLVPAWISFGQGKVNAYETDETGKMNGLLNIPQAGKVYAMIKSLMVHSKEP